MSKTKTYRRWTAEEVNFLRAQYASSTAKDIAVILGRTEDSVWEKSIREGLAKRGRRNDSTNSS